MKQLPRLLVADPIMAFILVGVMLQVCSTASTSFIEEEHSIWYFGWVTFLALIMTKPLPKENHVKVLALMVLHRILRRLNQTGDKWAASPDLSDWLKDSSRISHLSYFFATGRVMKF